MIVVVAALTSLLVADALGVLACALGIALLLDDIDDARDVAVAAVLAVCAPAYGFVPVVAHRGGYVISGCVGYLLCVAVAVVPVALAFAVTKRVAASLEGRALVLPLAWALASSLVPTLFPFRPAYLAVTSLPLAQWLSVFGLSGLDAIVIGTGTCVVVIARGRTWARVVAGLFVVGVFAGGQAMLVAERAARVPSLEVGIVSPAITLEEARDRGTRAARMHRLHASSARVAHAAIIVWPESVYPHRILPSSSADAPPPFGIRPVGARASLLVGASVGEGPCRPFSSLVAVDARGALTGRIDKQRLMPFGDVVPLRSMPAVARRFPCGTREGERFTPLSLGGARIGGLVCFDEISPDVAYARVRAGAELLVSASNDAWYEGTYASRLHARVARARAIETRRDLVRAVNLGEGGLVASTGEVLLSMRGDRQSARTVRVARRGLRTPAVRFGHLVEPMLALFLALFTAVSAIARRRAAARPGA